MKDRRADWRYGIVDELWHYRPDGRRTLCGAYPTGPSKDDPPIDKRCQTCLEGGR